MIDYDRISEKEFRHAALVATSLRLPPAFHMGQRHSEVEWHGDYASSPEHSRGSFTVTYRSRAGENLKAVMSGNIVSRPSIIGRLVELELELYTYGEGAGGLEYAQFQVLVFEGRLLVQEIKS